MGDTGTARSLLQNHERLAEDDAYRHPARPPRTFWQTLPRAYQPDWHHGAPRLLSDETRPPLGLGQRARLDPRALRINDQCMPRLEELECPPHSVAIAEVPHHRKGVVLQEPEGGEATFEIFRLRHAPAVAPGSERRYQRGVDRPGVTRADDQRTAARHVLGPNEAKEPDQGSARDRAHDPPQERVHHCAWAFPDTCRRMRSTTWSMLSPSVSMFTASGAARSG